MTVTVSCSQCGHENRIGQLFCTQCGAKLSVNQQSIQKAAKKADRKTGGIVARIIRLVVTLGLLVCLALMLWPSPVPSEVGPREEAVELRRTMEMLRTAAVTANPAAATVTESAINAYMAELVGSAKDPGGLSYTLKDVRIGIRPDHVTVRLNGSLGPAPLSYRVVGRVDKKEGERFHFHPDQVQIGRLPLPGFAESYIYNQVAGIFKGLQEEAILLNRLDRLELSEGTVEAVLLDH